MKNIKYTLILIAVFILSACMQPVSAQENVFIKEYIERLEQSKAYLILVAETMPEAQYKFRATAESMSFEEHLMHIAWAMDWHSQSLIGGRKARDWNTDTTLKVDNKSKKEQIKKIMKKYFPDVRLFEDDETAFKDSIDKILSLIKIIVLFISLIAFSVSLLFM